MADARLRQLDVPGFAPLATALADGAAAYRACTARHPAPYPGMRMWGETFASLAHALRGAGWDHERYLNVDLLVHRSRKNAIIVTAANEACGHRDISPQVRHERGEVITSLVNTAAVGLFTPATPLAQDCKLWFLLHRVRTSGIDGELSAPSGVARDGRVTGWIERILIPDNSAGGGLRRPSVPAPTSPVDFDIIRRGA